MRERERQEIEGGRKYFKKKTDRYEDDKERLKKRKNRKMKESQEIERGRKHLEI